MADEFKTYDKNPIVGVVQISKWSFGLREIILAVIAAFLLVLVLLFAGLFGKAEKDLAESSISASAFVGNNFCVDSSCLQTAARSVEFMNSSVEPCENFYQYACGNYNKAKPLGPQRGSRTVFDDMYGVNEDRLSTIMEQPVDRMSDWSAERKLKEFFQSCNDLYQREGMRGKPFLDKVVSVLGGWQLLGTWDEDSWDFNTALKKVQSDFWVDAFYQPRVRRDVFDTTKRAIELSSGGVGKWMFYPWYLNPWTEKIRSDYKKFIRRVGSLLLRDSGVVVNETTREMRLEEFVNDTFQIEYNIADIMSKRIYVDGHPYEHANRVSLAEMNEETDSAIDWVVQLSYLFTGGGVNADTRVVLMGGIHYFTNITTMISGLPDQDRKRMLHNYLIWRVAEVYVQDLSFEYIHANREIFVDIRGYTNFMGVYKYCFSTAKGYMPDAMSSLYISDHFDERNRQTAHDIADQLKTALQSQLDKTPWFDEATRNYAKEKLDMLTFKMGYPAWMANHDNVDEIYNGVDINVTDFLGNLFSITSYHRRLWSRELQRGENRDQWMYDTFDTNIGISWSWNEIIAPAGILQFPIYDSAQPHSATFGSLGSLLGRFLHHVVDELGMIFGKTGNWIRGRHGFWSNASFDNYQPFRQCVTDLYANVSKTYVFPDGHRHPVRIFPIDNTPRVIATTSGVRLAIEGYDLWAKDRGLAEKMLPGLSLTNRQMVMLSWAQSECTNRDPINAFYHAFRGHLPEELMVNSLLAELPEFADAFRCKKGDPLYHAKTCDYF